MLAHTGRAEVRDVARACVGALNAHGLAVRLLEDEAADLGLAPDDGLLETTTARDVPGEGCELALVIGGDGTILRAAELTRETSTPLLGSTSVTWGSSPRPSRRTSSPPSRPS